MTSTVRNTSNTVSTLVEHAQISNMDGGLIKSVNKSYSDIGDLLTYTISIKNTGNTTATNVMMNDTIPTGTSFNINSVTLNGTNLIGVNPETGVSIGSLGPNQAATVTFTVTVITIPVPNPIPNNSIINYNYTVAPTEPNGQSVTNISNTVTTQVNHGEVSNASGGLTKYVNKLYADVNEQLTYTIVLKNTGNVPVNNAILTDTIPNNTSFVPGSISVNGVPIGSSNPQTGINIGTINSGQTVTVMFKVQVLTIPSPNPIPNQSKISYSYTVDPALPNGKTVQNLSNTVYTEVNSATFAGSPKTVSPYYADIGDTVVYTIVVKNSGNTVANNVVFTDTIPSGTTFIENSVTIAGAPSPGSNPEAGIPLGSIPAGGSIIITFSVLVKSLPIPNPILNQGTISYTYTVDPSNPDGKSGSNPTTQSTNKINTGLLNPQNGSILKTTNKTYVSIGDSITYGLNIKNLGNATINNLVLNDTVPSCLTFTNGSLTINGVPQPGGNIQNGVFIGSVPPQASSTVTFKATVNSIPPSGQAVNNFLATYTYTVDPAKPNGTSRQTLSNDVINYINDAIIGKGPNSFSKVVDKAYADLGDILTYTIVLENTGNVPGNNVVVTDPIPNGTSLVPDSVTLNGSPTSQTPQGGILVGTINPNTQAIITFQVTAVTIPTPNPIRNIANVRYNYTKDPNVPNGETVTGSSVPAITQINHGEIPPEGFRKDGDKTIVKRGDKITYTVTIPNTGNTTISNVVFTDPLPPGTALVPNTVVVNGILQPGASPEAGIFIGTIAPKAFATIKFTVVVNSIPPSEKVINQGYATYQYIVDPNLPPVSNSVNSNISTILIKDASINNLDGGFIKEVDKLYCQLNETLNYSFTLRNTGNVTATNIVFTDTLVNTLAFVSNSVILKGVSEPLADPQLGIMIPTLGPNQTVTLSFKAITVSIPNDRLIPDSANVIFSFIQDPTKPPSQGTGSSNVVITTINSTNFTGNNFTKASSPYYATIGDILDYSFFVNNAGNIVALNTVFTDSLPASLSFVSNSFKISGAVIPGANPVLGVPLGNIGINTPMTLNFKVLVMSIPSPNPTPNKGTLSFSSQVTPDVPPTPGTIYSNIALNQINTPNLQLIKSSLVNAVAVGDTLDYTLVAKNTGNVTAENVTIYDPLAPELTYIEKSLVINGVSIPNQDIVSGINIGDLSVGETVTINFSALVNTVPATGYVENQAMANYIYIVDPAKTPIEGNTQSNRLQCDVFTADLKLIKTANTETAILNQIITYTVKITNTGNLTATNIIFRDEISTECQYVPNTFYLNDRKINGVDLTKGINVGNLDPGQSLIIKYDVILVKVCRCGVATNAAFATFRYRASASSTEKTKSVGPSIAKVITASSSFKEIGLDGILVVPYPKLDIEEVNELTANVEITNYYIINTLIGESDENRKLTGFKLIINGLLTQSLEYTANDNIQSVHSAFFERKFSSFIVLPADFQIGTEIRVKGIVEDVYFNQLNSREVFSNVTILLDAVILC